MRSIQCNNMKGIDENDITMGTVKEKFMNGIVTE